MGNTGSQVYSDAAGAGIIFSSVELIVASIIGLGMIAGGIYFLTKKNGYTQSATATIDTKSCVFNNNQWDCTLSFHFTTSDGKNISITPYTVISDVNYGSLTTFKIYYDPSNPSNVSINQENPKIVGIILIAFALIFAGFSYFWYWASKKNKFIASTVGVSGGLSLLSGGRLGGIV